MRELKNINIEGTRKTPKIEFNYLKGELTLQGRSFPENIAIVYQPLLNWISEYIKTPRNETNLHLKLEYFNSSTLFWIIKIIKLLCKIDKEKSVLYIHIYFDNEDFDYEEADELKDVISSVFDNIGKLKVTIGIKIQRTDSKGKGFDESTIII
jgi:hypothetical protein